jgi:hypothetical protein
VVGKQQWLDRYRLGELTTEAFGWTTIQVRVNGNTAGPESSRRSPRYRGEDCSWDFLCTLVAVRRDNRWTIVNIQLSRAPSGP